MEDTAVCENSSNADIAVSATEANLGMGSIVLGPRRDQINRKRLKELFALAYETVEWLEKKGLKKGEQCEFREIAERLWWKE